MSRISRSMKGQGFTVTFPLIYIPRVINQFIFGPGVVIYFIMQSLFEKEDKTDLFSFLLRFSCSPPSCLFCQMMSSNILLYTPLVRYIMLS